MTTAARPAPTCTSAMPAGFTMPCPCCGEAEAAISVNLASLDDPDAAFECRECNTEFGVEHVRTFIRRWAKVLAWVDMMPDMSDE
jgi:hypothetical protein